VRLTADLAVVGSGFGGSLVASIARRLGLSVALLERGVHPRFAIGESSSPLANILLETLAARYGLPRLAPLARYGSWCRAYPSVARGLKRGFTFYAHRPDEPFAADPERDDQMLVAASPRDEIADTHWYRPDFDHFLLREAQEAGALYFDRVRLDRVEERGGGVSLEGERAGAAFAVSAHLAVDASGPRGFLHRALGAGETTFPTLPETEALYAHFRGVRRLDTLPRFAAGEAPPYPIDDAAVHHVFPDGWIWVLRFDNGITSAGVAATAPLAREIGFAEGEAAWRRLLDRLPTVREQFQGSEPIVPFVHTPRLSFRAGLASGPGFTLLPSAAAFVDPLLSTGFPLTLLGIERLARALEQDWGSARLAATLARDAQCTLFEADSAAQLIGALYATFDDFPLFSALCRLYFAAASYSEAARRLGRKELAGSFLCADRPDFGPALRACCEAALSSPGATSARRQALFRDVLRAIAPIDVAGLSDPGRRNWFPMDTRDLLCGAAKLDATPEEIESMLTRAGMLQARPTC
jgi:FADH2 O2-dependent halogenase